MVTPEEKPRVLYVDDSEDFLDLFEMLYHDFFVIEVVQEPENVLSILKRKTFDAILTDYDMPDLNGLELLKLIKERYPSIPVFLYTGQGNEEVARQAFLAGASDYFIKDISGFAHREKVVNSVFSAVEKKKTEDALEQSLATSKEIFSSIPSGLIICNYEFPDRFYIIDVNVEAEKIIGQTAPECRGKTIDEVMSGETAGKIRNILYTVMETGRIHHDDNFYYKDEQQEGVFRVKVFKITDNRVGLAVENVTEIKQTREALKTTREHYRMLIETMSDGLNVLDENAKITYVNERWQKMTGYGMEEAVGYSFEKFLDRENRQIFRENWENLKTRGENSFELTLIKKDGSPLSILTSPRGIFDQDRNFRGSFAVIVDITDRIRMEEVLKNSEEDFRLLFESSPESIVLLNSDGILVNCNQKTLDLSGLRKEELVGKHFTELPMVLTRDIPRFLDLFEKAKAGEKIDSVEIQIEPPGRGQRWFEIYLSSVIKDGKLEGVQVISRDITDRIVLEKEARHVEELYETLFDNSPEAYYIHDMEGNLIEANKAVQEITGFDRSDMSEYNLFSSHLLPEYLPKLKRVMTDLASGYETDFTEFKFRRKDGSILAVETRGIPIDINGTPCVLGVMRDLTGRDELREQLEQSKELFMTLFNASPYAYYIHDLNGIMIDGNKAAEEITGYKKEELLGKNFLTCGLLSNAEIPRAMEHMAVEIAGGVSEFREFDLTRKDGSKRTVLSRGYPIIFEGKKCILGVSKDVSEVRKVETRLKRNEEQYSFLYENSPVMMISLDSELKITEANNFFLRTIGLSKDEILGRNFLGLLSDDSRKHAVTSRQLDFIQADFRSINLEIIRKNGEPLDILFTAMAQRNEEERIEQILAVIVDMSERKKEEERIHKANRMLRSVIDSSPLATIKLDLGGRVLMWNPAAEKLFGWKEDEVIGDLNPIVSPENWASFYKSYKKILHGENIIGKEIYRKKKDGSLVALNFSAAPVYDFDNRISGVIEVFEDIEKRKKIERELLSKNKELEDFAYIVSHDLKGPINVMRGFLDVINQNPESFSTHYGRIVKQLDKLISFINNLLKLSKAGKAIGRKKLINIRFMVKKIFSVLVPSGIDAELVVDSPIQSIYGDPVALEQVFTNLVQNSLRYRDEKKEKLVITVTSSQTDNLVRVSFSDNGQGIAAKNLEKVFHAGLTLKKNRGTGFGLAITKRIIAAHNGEIWAESNGIGKGSTFHIELPFES